MTVTTVINRTLTCDRCGKQTVLQPDEELPTNWRKLSVAMPSDPTVVTTVDLHPSCTRDYESFVSNLLANPRDPAT